MSDVGIKIGGNSAEGEAALRRVRDRAAELRQEAVRVSTTNRDMATSMTTVTRNSGAMRAQVQNASYQVADFAVQVSGGTSATRAFGQQAPQLLGAFGMFGAIAGAAVAILVPLAGYMFSSAKATDDLKESLSGLDGGLGGVRGQISQLSSLQETYTKAIERSSGASAATASVVAANSKKEFEARKQVLGIELELLKIRGQEIADRQKNLADSIRREADAAVAANLRDSRKAFGGDFGEFVNLAPRNLSELNSELGGFIERNQEASRTVRQLSAELQLNALAIDEATRALDGDFSTSEGADASSSKSGGGSGGSVADRMKSRLQALQEGLMTEREALEFWRTENINLLQEALDRELLTEEEHRERLLRLEQQYQEKLRGIRSAADGGALQSVLRSGEEIVGAIGQSNEKALRVARTFGAATALVNAYQAASETLKDPSLPWWGRIAAASSVLAAGLGFVSSIKSINSSGGGGGGARGGGAAAAAAPQRPLEVYMPTLTADSIISGASIGNLLRRLDDEAGDRGYRLMVPA